MLEKKPGRPLRSIVRERLKEILAMRPHLTAYEAHKLYCSLFAKVSQRNIYYQLKKGFDLDEFVCEELFEKGHNSWGDTTRKIYYSLSPNQKISVSKDVFEFFFKN